MRQLFISITSTLKKITFVIGNFFKVIFLSIYSFFKHIALSTSKVIKAIALFLWKYVLSYIFKFLYRVGKGIYYILSKLLIYLYKAIVGVCRFIYKYFIKYILTMLFRVFTIILTGLKRIYSFIVKYVFMPLFSFIYKYLLSPIIWGFKKIHRLFLYIGSGLIKLVKLFSRFIYQKILLNIYRGFIKFSKFIYNKIINKLFKAIKKIFILIYENVILVIAEGIHKFVLKPFLKLIKLLYRAFAWLIIKIFITIKLIGRIIWKTVVNIYVFIKWIIKSSYYLFLLLPNLIHHLFQLTKIYFVLIIHIIYIVIFKYLLFNIPRIIFSNIFKFLINIINLVFSIIYRIINKISKFIFKLFEVIYVYIRDYSTYYYILLISPIIVLVFIIMFLWAIIYLFPIYMSLFIKSLVGTKVLAPNEIIYLKESYDPIVFLIKNMDSYLLKIKLNYTLSIKFKTTWFLILLITWQLIYKLIFFIPSIMILLPISLISKIFYKDKRIENQIKISSHTTNGLVMLRNSKFQGNRIEFVIERSSIDQESRQSIIELNEENEVKVKVYIKKKLFREYKFKVMTDEAYSYISVFNKIKNDILLNKTYKVLLPTYKHELFTVRYEKIWSRDIIYFNTLTLRTLTKHTDVKVLFEDKNKHVLFEQNIELNKLINPSKLRRLQDKIIKVRYKENLLKYLPKGFLYEFKTSNYIDGLGNILAKDDINLDIDLSVKNLNDSFKLSVYLLGSKSILKTYLNKLRTDLIDDKNELVNLSNIKRNDGSIIQVTWHINNELQTGAYNNKELYNKIKLNTVNIFHVSFMFNGKIKTYKIRLKRNKVDDGNYQLMLANALANKFTCIDIDNQIYVVKRINYIFNKKVIYLPNIVLNKILCIRFIPLDRKDVKYSGLILNNDSDSLVYKVIIYLNIFDRKEVVIQLKVNN